MTHIRREFIEEFADNTNRHELGIGLLGRCLGLRRKAKIDADVQRQLDAIGAKTYRQVVSRLRPVLCVSFVQYFSTWLPILVRGIGIKRWDVRF